ncbi:jg23222 [Pararge aegeria aegeria]|uniref:Jg23222 protein n=1 Tax=Pararge aegeria aegeria TaxID=348720 RepID=A0A8S4RHZ5_9NEOP|nr:jg23222 [Pararge aegeria aegeria]
MMNFANFVIPRGRLHCRQLQLHARTLSLLPPCQPVSISAPVVAHLKWWFDILEGPQVKNTFHPELMSHFMTTDAAHFGWGPQVEDFTTSGKWRPDQLNWHCNRQEMFASIAAVSHHYKHRLQNQHLVFQTDNRTVVSVTLLNLTYQLMGILDRWNISITAKYLPGRFNDIADGLSRGKKASEEHLKKPALRKIFKTFGTPQIDLFATNQTKFVENYASKDHLDSSATFCNVFSRIWNYQLAWVFPPPSLIPRVLHHLNSAQGTFLVVAPMWKKAFWLPDLCRRALRRPLSIPDLEYVLIDQFTGLAPPRVQEMQRTEHWSQSEKNFLKLSWRESTLKTYKPDWAIRLKTVTTSYHKCMSRLLDQKVLEFERTQTGKPKHDSLFITVKGETRVASRTVICNWVGFVLKDANIQASPGRVPSAVASLNWYENLPIEDIPLTYENEEIILHWHFDDKDVCDNSCSDV